MNADIIRTQLGRTVDSSSLPDLGEPYRGKVRDVYRRGTRLVLVTSDRISAFDHILRQTIPFKGQVLNRLAAHFFDLTADVVPNHIIAVPDPNVTIGRRCEPFPVEFVVRGYLAGHAWREYSAGRRSLCGVTLPDGLRQNERLPHPVLTPATKAEEGHDEDISRAEIIDRGIIDENVFEMLEDMALSLFERGTEIAAARGLILVDTKYEFGRDADGKLLVIDEVHTPDSSRYFYTDTYARLLASNEAQRQLSKEFVREWLMAQGFQGKEGQYLPDLTDDFRVEIASRYIELFETVTGTAFEPDTHPDPDARIRKSVADYFANE
jgi:phosphoribosylaminoimidazole-succinocarboxamide synthase